MEKQSIKTILFFIIATGIFFMLLPATVYAYDETYYVASWGNDGNDGLTPTTPFATLSKTDNVINSNGPGGDYLIIVMTDLTSTACARYFDNNVTITSLAGEQFTVTRGAVFTPLRDNARSWYNPPMLEIETGDLSPTAPLLTLTLEHIIFDDNYLHMGTKFDYTPTYFPDPDDPSPPPPPAGWGSGDYVQDAIIASYAPCATIILGDGAELHNFGGMTAVRAADGATLKMEAGSLIADIGSTTATREVSSVSTDYRANGEAAVIIINGGFYMYDGAKITDIANANSVKFSGAYKCFIDGEIANMKGNKGWDATDHITSGAHDGRGFKSAVHFSSSSKTLDPDTGLPGSAIIGPNANIHNNSVKCGAVCISRSPDVSVIIFGKINDNIGQSGTSSRTIGPFTVDIGAGTNGGGIYIVLGGTVYLEEGSEVCNNSVMGPAYGAGINVQQRGSKLIMNGGLVKDNYCVPQTVGGITSPAGMGPGIAVNKGGDCYFEMNGGTVDNGPNGVLLFNNRVVITLGFVSQTTTDTDCNGRLILNEGNVSGVTVNSLVAYGTNTADQYRNLYISDNVTIGTGYVAVSGTMAANNTTNVPRQVKLLPAGSFGGMNIGNPNKDLYPTISTSLPDGWTMPSSNESVIAFWMKKDGRADFSVPAPTTGTEPTNYNRTLGIYFAAVQPTNATGAIDPSFPLKLYPITMNGTNIEVSVPLADYPNGALVALVQPSTEYGEIVFDAPPALIYDINATDYLVTPCNATYDMPQGLFEELKLHGHDNTNTTFTFTIIPDSRTVLNLSNLTISGDIFEINTTALVAGEAVITLDLQSGWKAAADLNTTFEFNCDMVAANYTDNDFLHLTGNLVIESTVSPGKYYFVYGNDARTWMEIPKYTMTYDANGGSGTVPTETDKAEGVTFIIASGATLTGPASEAFKEWNTAPNGTGTRYVPGNSFTMPGHNVTLYAQWNVSGGGDGGSGYGNATIVPRETPSSPERNISESPVEIREEPIASETPAKRDWISLLILI